jgi:hypothetical protein
LYDSANTKLSILLLDSIFLFILFISMLYFHQKTTPVRSIIFTYFLIHFYLTPTLPFQNYGVSYHLAKSRLNPLSAAIYYPFIVYSFDFVHILLMKQVPTGTSCKPAALVNKKQPNLNPPSRGTTGRY